MVYLHTFLWYTFIASPVMFYGIEINRTIQITSEGGKVNFKMFVKSFSMIFVTTVLSFLVANYILIPINLGELYPLLSLLLFLSMNTFVEAIVRLTAKSSTAEFTVSWLIVLLALSEGSSLVEAILICSSCALSYLLMVIVMQAFQRRMYDSSIDRNEKKYVFLFLSIAVLMMISAAFDVSWLNL